MPEAKVLVAVDGRAAWVKVTGRATFACSTPLRDFGRQVIHDSVPQVLIDLSECERMDSTFMGTLALIAQQGRRAGTPVRILRASAKADRLLDELGLCPLFAGPCGEAGNIP